MVTMCTTCFNVFELSWGMCPLLSTHENSLDSCNGGAGEGGGETIWWLSRVKYVFQLKVPWAEVLLCLLRACCFFFLFCSVWLQLSINWTVFCLQPEHITRGDQWKVTQAMLECLQLVWAVFVVQGYPGDNRCIYPVKVKAVLVSREV